MEKVSILCECGNTWVPLLLQQKEDRRLVRSAYCPDCVFYEFPNLNFFSPQFLAEAQDPQNDGKPFVLDPKTVGCYSVDFGGFFAYRLEVFVAEFADVFTFATPFLEHVSHVPICLKCKHLRHTGMIEMKGLWYTTKKCTMYQQEWPSVARFSCPAFKSIHDEQEK